jgi:serine protease Do
MENEKFYQEIIETKPKEYGKKTIILLLLIGFIIGIGFGLGVDQLLKDYQGGNQVAYATGTTGSDIIPSQVSSISPVVPIAKKVSPSIVAIETKSAGRDFFGQRFESKGTGSGIIIDNQGHIVTNNHVVKGAQNLTVILKDGTKLDAVLVGRDERSDTMLQKSNIYRAVTFCHTYSFTKIPN